MRIGRPGARSRLPAVLLGFFLAIPAQAGFFDQFTDPEDGLFDASAYLASARGFLPVPIIITEPAVGYGLGAAVAYFHAPRELDPAAHPHRGPPSISFGFGAYTENDTYFYGGGHSGVWRDDHVRYLGVAAGLSLNAEFFGLNSGRPDAASPNSGSGEARALQFNSEGWFIYQQAQARLGESNWWLGGSYVWMDIDNTFELGADLPIDIPALRFTTRNGGLGAFVEYDGRNTTFTPTSGTRAQLKYTRYDEDLGGDFDYDWWEGKVHQFFPVGAYSSLGLRLDGTWLEGKAPFFLYPFVDLRGIQALRYQGEQVLVAEAEYLWGFTPRWSLALFYGVGWTWGVDDSGGNDRSVGAGGVGIRYRLARQLGLQAGIDVAKGPEDEAFYITVGSAWR